MLVRGNMERMSNHHLDSSRDVPFRKWTRSAAVKASENGWPVTSSASDTSTTRFMSMMACGTVSGYKKNEKQRHYSLISFIHLFYANQQEMRERWRGNVSLKGRNAFLGVWGGNKSSVLNLGNDLCARFASHHRAKSFLIRRAAGRGQKEYKTSLVCVYVYFV